MRNKKFLPLLIIFTIILAVTAVVLAQRIYFLRNEPVAPTAPKSKPKAADNLEPSASCMLSFSLQELTPTPTSPTTPTTTLTPGPTSSPPSCGTSCNINSNNCPSDSPYCIDYEGDNLGPICGRQTLAGQGPKCENPKPGCDELCDVNDNQCPSDAKYCVDYEGDGKAAVCGRQSLAGQGPQCNPTPTPTTIEIPQAGVLDNTIWAGLGGLALIILGLLFL